MTFIDEEIKVTTTELGAPARFAWRGIEYIVEKIVTTRIDRRFGKAAPRTKTWRLRHHRNCFRVKTDKGVFELYRDRGAKNRPWVLLTQIEP